MERWAIFAGGTGSRVMESLVWAACEGMLRDETGPLDVLHLLLVDMDPACPYFARAEKAVEAYEKARKVINGTAGGCFITALDLQRWVGECRAAASELQGNDALLRDTLLSREEAAMDGRGGFRGKRRAAKLAMASTLQEKPGVIEEAAAAMRKAADAGNKVRLTLCGALHGAAGAAGLSLLARMLRERLPGEALEICGVLVLPYTLPEETDGKKLIASAKETLREEALLPGNGLLDAATLLGMPEDMLTKNTAGAQLPEDLAAMAVGQYLAQGGKGVHSVRLAHERLDWQSFGETGMQWRQALGGLLCADAMLEAELAPAMEERLSKRRSLGLQIGMLGKLMHGVKDEEKKTLCAQLGDVRACMTMLVRHLSEVAEHLPVALLNMDVQQSQQQKAAENYRRLLDVAGELALMEGEIRRSGMAEERTVRRNAQEETVADRMLKQADALRTQLAQLEQEQQVYVQRIGGAAQDRLYGQMMAGIDRAKAREEEALAAGNKGAQTMQERDAMHRLERHLLLLEAQKKRVAADMRYAVATEASWRAPALPGEARANDLLDIQALHNLMQLAEMPLTETKARRRLASAVLEQMPNVMLPTGNVAWTQKAVRDGMRHAEAGSGTAVGQMMQLLLAAAMGEEA